MMSVVSKEGKKLCGVSTAPKFHSTSALVDKGLLYQLPTVGLKIHAISKYVPMQANDTVHR